MMRGSRNSAFLFVLLAGLLVSAFQSSTSYGQLPVLDFVVLRGATVIDGLGNPPLADATVIVEGDRIRSIAFAWRGRIRRWVSLGIDPSPFLS